LTGESPHHRRRWVKPSRLIASPTDFYPIEQLQTVQFTGGKWQLFARSSTGIRSRIPAAVAGRERPCPAIVGLQR
jgi:hypothetical protein